MCTAVVQDFATADGFQACAKAVSALADYLARLESAFHDSRTLARGAPQLQSDVAVNLGEQGLYGVADRFVKFRCGDCCVNVQIASDDRAMTVVRDQYPFDRPIFDIADRLLGRYFKQPKLAEGIVTCIRGQHHGHARNIL
jgi:hypothetical protein